MLGLFFRRAASAAKTTRERSLNLSLPGKGGGKGKTTSFGSSHHQSSKTFHSSFFGDAKAFSLFAARSGFVRKNSSNNTNNIRERSIKREFFTRGERDSYDNYYSRGGYTTTTNESRRDTSVVWMLIGANTAVYLAWQEPENFKTMRTHFLVSESSLANGYWHTALTAAFSHNSFNHLFGNMFTLYFFGRDVALACGGAYLLNLYLVGGVVSSLAHVGYERYERRKRKPHVGFFDKREHESFFSWFDERMDKIARLAAPASLGASGAVNSIIAMSVMMMPHRKIYLYGILPLESWVFGAMFLLRDYAGLGTQDGIGHSAHLGGAAVGALAFLLRNGRMIR
ncbi:predicted protein [Bathycoccus prasinos]|uniref:Peptidase S54 rhomboid domain-containing protein n=1 Tax=Bathycoccus prasinos TaxID=41875 RepID=K8F344_9CHLO|nr:predicted protein [Bathycoccus prasinos]CCO66495.1 predicted protein [Bathycoccus prasinos]|eukprot:XP_007510935.1 predicted protein [Bathycoccus prasinos]